MKHLSFIYCLLFMSSVAFTQVKSPIIKSYGYTRESARGTKPSVVGEDGSQSAQIPNKPGSLQLFIECLKPVSLKPVRVWIEGKTYLAKFETIKKTPLLFKRQGIGNSVETDTLVKKTNNAVYSILLGKEISITTTKSTNMKQGVWLQFLQGNKMHSLLIKDISVLAPLVLQ